MTDKKHLTVIQKQSVNLLNDELMTPILAHN